MVDRFRLIYLKSTELEESSFNKPISSLDEKRMTVSSSSPARFNIPETFSSEAILRQAEADMKHPDPKVRILGIKYYIEKKYPSLSVSLLQEILSDRDPEVRAQALRSLIQFRSPIVSPFFKKYLKDSSPKVRIAALRGVFQNKEKIDLNLLLQFLSDESSRVRRKVAILLGWTPMEGSLPILIELARDPDSIVKKAALFSLTALYPEESENRLMEAMADSDPALRKWIKMTLEEMGGRPLKKRIASPMSRV
jgi:HEAT repeat protein